MDKYDKDLIIDKYISNLQHDYDNIKRMCGFLIIEDKRCKKLVNDSLELIDNKINDIINSKSIEDVKRHVKLKKLLKKYGDSQ